jgi:AcrR family transcriptional regulator
MAEYAGRGDPRVILPLLWGRTTPAARGPRPKVSAAEIVATAVKVADAEGLDAVSMRRVAQELGRSTMSLYSHVPGKAELLDLMIDAVLAEQPTVAALDGDWRAALEATAREAVAFYQRHPWVLQVAGGRSVSGPHELDGYEAVLRVLAHAGLRGTQLTRAASAFDVVVRGGARGVVEARAAGDVTGVSDDDWWTDRGPLLDEILSEVGPQRYPTLMTAGAEGGYDQSDREPDDATPYLEREALDAFAFALARFLDGLEAHLAR